MNNRHLMAGAALALGLIALPSGARAGDVTISWAAAAQAGEGPVLKDTHDDKGKDLGDGTRFLPARYDSNDDDRPPGWDRGNKKGWDGRRVPPGQAKKNGRYSDRDENWRTDDRDDWRYDDRDRDYNYYSRTVTGIVTRSTSEFDRKIRVRLDNGEQRTVNVDRNAPVRRAGRAISIHEVRSGEQVRMELDRYRRDGDLQARRIEVTGRTSNRPWYEDEDRYDDRRVSFSGTVRSIDSRNDILRVNEGSRTVIVSMEDAELRDRRGRISLRDLENGDRVTVEGRRTGDRVTATRVTLR